MVSLTFSREGMENVDEIRQVLAGTVGVVEVKTSNDGLLVFVKNAASKIPELFGVLNKNGIKVESISVSQPSLNDVFLKYTGHHIRDEENKSGVDPMMRMWLRGGR